MRDQKEFNWEEFISSNNIGVHCATEEQAIDFCKKMHEHGLKWMDKQSYLLKTRFENYKENTCYIGHGKYVDRNYCEINNYTILEWSDYTSNE